ncbi:phage/plasmid primase, P4 family [Candidatus Poribacteria bacterium]
MTASSFQTGYDDMLPCVPNMMRGVSTGCRDVATFTLAKHFRVSKKFPQDATEAILQTWNQQNSPPLEPYAITQKVRSAYTGRDGRGYTSLGCDEPLIADFCQRESCRVFNRSAGGTYFNGNVFVPKRLADKLMAEHSFVSCGGTMNVYQGGVYKPAGEPFVKRICREHLREDSRTHYINEVMAHISDMTYAEPDDLNTHKHLVNMQNGMFDLREDRLIPHSPEFLSTIRIPVDYDPKSQFESSRIARFLADVLPSDCIDLIEEFFGYALIPDNRFGKAFMLTGGGANGKSTLLNLLERFIGRENVSKVPLQELDQHRFKRADLFGKLVNMFPDLNAHAVKSSTYFKAVTTGDVIDAERKNRDPFYFRPFARMIFSANEIPSSSDRSFAYYRRWSIIPFPNQFVGENADTNLIDRLTQPDELSALLNQALIG